MKTAEQIMGMIENYGVLISGYYLMLHSKDKTHYEILIESEKLYGLARKQLEEIDLFVSEIEDEVKYLIAKDRDRKNGSN